MKDFLEKMITSKEARAKELREQIKNSEDINEVRSLGDTLEALLSELAEAKAQLEAMDEPAAEENMPAEEGRSFNPIQSMELRNGETKMNKVVDVLDTEEYRKAFMEFACRGTAIPAELRTNTATTKTTDASAVIPTTILNEIVSELKVYGNLFAQVRKLNVQGGVTIPILSLKPTATWISADAGESESTTQKLQANTSVTFNYYGLECKISQTLLVNVTTLQMFQDLFVPMAVEAIAKALDIAIMNGDGTGEPLGILNDTRIPNANKVTLSSTEIASWADWKKKVFGAMKKAYRNGKFFMAQATFDGYIDGMVDSVNQPIGRVNYGIDGEEKYRFGGKAVETVETDVIKDYESASNGDVIAVFLNPTDYAINSNLEMQTVKWVDHDTNEIKNKVILIADGKLVDPYGVILIKKGA